MSKRVRQEEGIALVMALGMMVVLIILVAATISFTSESARNSRISGSRVDAQAIAESGIGIATSIINHASNVASPALLGCSTASGGVNSALPCTDIAVNVPGGTAYVHGLYAQGSGSTGAWTISAYGSVVNPTGAANLTRTMTATVTISNGGQSNNVSVWNYLYSTAPSDGNPNTCEVTMGADHDTITTPMYVTGDLCITADHGTIMQDTSGGGQPVDLRVGGGVTITGAHATVGCDPAGSLGTCGGNTSPLFSGYSALGCRTSSVGTYHTCTTADHWYVSQTDSPLTATPPTVDFPGWYANASPGPSHTCDSTLTPSPNLMTTQPHAFDNDATMNGTNTVFNMTPTNADYNCVTAATSTCPSGQTLDWNHTTHLLTICGTFFFDGNLEFTDGAASYSGKATVYANGEILFNNAGTAAGITANCPVSGVPHQCGINNGTWNPNTNMLLLASNKSSGTAIDLSVDHSEFQGDLYCPPTSSNTIAGDHTIVEGGIICGKFSFADHTLVYPLPTITNLPPGAPLPPNAPATVGTPVITSG